MAQKRKNILNQITGKDAIAILKILAKDKQIASKINAIAKEYWSDVDIDTVSAKVYSALDNLDVEDVWNNSGSTIGGYLEPNEVAWEMFEKVLEPFRQEMRKYIKLKMDAQAKHCCMGILQGIHEFETTSTSQYKEWVGDAPGECFGQILEEWEESTDHEGDQQEMEEFVSKHRS